MIFGILAWIFLHLMSIPDWLVWTLLVVVGGLIVFLDLLRVQAAKAFREKRNYKLTKWRARELALIELIIWFWQHIACLFYRFALGRGYTFHKLEDWFTPKHQWVLSHWLRSEKEEYHMATAVHTVAGMVCIYILFPVYIVVFAVLFQGVADPAAKWVGMHTGFVRFSKPRLIEGKSLGGLGAGFAVCVMAGFMVLSFDLAVTPLFPDSISIPSRLVMIWIGCAAAPIAELFGGKWDNFWIPVVSGFAMWTVL